MPTKTPPPAIIARLAPPSKAVKQDDQVKATNNSSIVSKRSVERLYYPDEPHFFRFFVKKYQRRAPLINRGYFLRLHVIDVSVRDFLAQPSDKTKVVVNLGCGSDVLPWQCLTRYPEHCQGVRFVDVDFPDLMEKKRQTVLATPELKQAFSGLEVLDGSPVMLKSDQYVQIGCDLRQLGTLQDAISSIVDRSQCLFMFVAEVSVTYMETGDADRVIEWAGNIGDAEFCLLEQILPDGLRHPFASTMLSHFEKLNTPLKSVHAYPRLQDQVQRFTARGWKTVDAWTLWQAWADPAFLSAPERRRLDDIEPFDEWEDFALFASHYCLVRASTEQRHRVMAPLSAKSELDIPVERITMAVDEHRYQREPRRFGAAMTSADCMGDGVVLNLFGSAANTRPQSCDVFRDKCSTARLQVLPGAGPSSRMCHTLTPLGPAGILLAGGRTSPTSPLRDCWIVNMGMTCWSRTHDLPKPLYRHSATWLWESSLALVMGGKDGPSTTAGECLVYHPSEGWRVCEIVGQGPTPVSGAILSCLGRKARTCFYGILAGGLKEDGVISDQYLFWELGVSDNRTPKIVFTQVPIQPENHDRGASHSLLSRYGANCVQYTNSVVICGGVMKDELLEHQDEILRCTVTSEGITITSRLVMQNSVQAATEHPRPLFIGNSLAKLDSGQIISVGGGATCFSMGTFWNKAMYRFSLPDRTGHSSEPPVDGTWMWFGIVEITTTADPNGRSHADNTGDSTGKNTVVPLPEVTLASPHDFMGILKSGRPVVFKGLDLGPCVGSWGLDELVNKVGKDRKIVVHEASTEDMNFNKKNFSYNTMLFGELIQRIRRAEKLYLRALSADGAADKPTKLTDDFPTLAADFMLPPELSFVSENLFSSVLRISGPVKMWLHYDVMANVYCQINGTKHVILYPPSDVVQFKFPPGASSSSVQIHSLDNNPVDAAPTHPHVATLAPGDVLFLPPLWLHTTTPETMYSVAVNVFFKDLDQGYSSGRDVYGNRDLAAYEKGRQDVAKIANYFRNLPVTAREFYLLRLADELRQKAAE